MAFQEEEEEHAFARFPLRVVCVGVLILISGWSSSSSLLLSSLELSDTTIYEP